MILPLSHRVGLFPDAAFMMYCLFILARLSEPMTPPSEEAGGGNRPL